MLRTVSLFGTLYLIWLLFSGHFEPLFLLLGLVSAALVVFLAHRMDVVDHEGHPIDIGWGFLTYLPWLTWETIKSNIAVARLILDPRMPISPSVFSVDATQSGDLGKTIYANSITLTPGTVSMGINGQEILVHAISQDAAEDLMQGEMDRRVTGFSKDC